MSGTVVVSTFASIGGPATEGRPCDTLAGPDGDVHAGAPVLVFDTVPHILGAALLSAGHAGRGGCQFTFHLSVPPGGSWYEFQVAGHPTPAFSRSQLSAITINLG